jgi:hypothetical protein
LYDALPPVVRSICRAALIGALHHPAPSAARYAMQFARGKAKRHPPLVGRFTPEDKAGFHLPPMQAAASCATIERLGWVPGESASRSAIGRLADLDSETCPTDDINVKIDIASTAHAFEVRCPHLSTRRSSSAPPVFRAAW